MSSEWCTVESDPGIFSELIAMFGVKDVAMEEIYSLDDTDQSKYDLRNFKSPKFILPPLHLIEKEKCHGLIFLFKWQQELARDDREVIDPSFIPELFFARQIVTNACATQAILSILLNADGIDLGEELNQFKSFTTSLDAETKGIAIGNSDSIRIAHNSFGRAEPFLHENAKVPSYASSEDVYHFVAYIPFGGGVYEYVRKIRPWHHALKLL